MLLHLLPLPPTRVVWPRHMEEPTLRQPIMEVRKSMSLFVKGLIDDGLHRVLAGFVL